MILLCDRCGHISEEENMIYTFTLKPTTHLYYLRCRVHKASVCSNMLLTFNRAHVAQ